MGQLSITLTPDQKVAAALGVALVLAIAGTAAPKIAIQTFNTLAIGTVNSTSFEQKIDDTLSYGLFRKETSSKGYLKTNGTQVNIDSVIREQNDCVRFEASLDSNSTKKDQDCASEKGSKCKASKAFAVLGILSNCAAIALCFFNKTLFGTLASASSSFAYLVVFAVSNSVYKSDGDPDYCTLAVIGDFKVTRGSVFAEISMGASFGLFVAAFVVTAAAAVVNAMKYRGYTLF